MPNLKEAVALGVLLLAAAFFAPTLISATNETTTSTVELQVDQTANQTEYLQTEADAIDVGNNSTITVRNTNTLSSEQNTIDVADTQNYTVDGQDVNVTVDSTDTRNGTDYVIISVEYNPDFGWGSGASTVFDNLGLLIAVVGFIMVVGVLGSALKP